MTRNWRQGVGVNNGGKVKRSGSRESLAVINLDFMVVGGRQKGEGVERIEGKMGNAEAVR